MSELDRLEWIASARKDLKDMPEDVQDAFGYALYLAQIGDKHEDAKPFKIGPGAGVLEVVEDFDKDTYRCLYTVRFKGVVFVLDAFKKKSKTGIKTPQGDVDRIKARYKQAEAKYKEMVERGEIEP